MGLLITLSIHQQDDIAFDDLDALNTDLMAGRDLSELYEEFTALRAFDGPFKFAGSELQIAQRWDSEFGGYGETTMVWGCYSDELFEIISRHLTQGKLVFFIEIEGNDNEYRIVTPNNVEQKLASQLSF